jgi:citrate lyase subunit beta/citryl-CoA lyase
MLDLFQPKAFLFVPVCEDRILNSSAWTQAAAQAGAVILDLEDSLAPTRKWQGRSRLTSVAQKFRPLGCLLLARVNNDANFGADVAACLNAGIEAVVIPKLRDAGEAKALGEEISQIEKQEVARFSIGPIPLLETPAAVLHPLEIASALGDCAALFFGPEDLSAELGIEPRAENLLLAAQNVIMAAAALEVPAVGTLGSFSLYSAEEMDEFTATLKRSRDLGFSGAFAGVHVQVAAINKVFRLSEAERAQMERVIEHAGACDRSVFSLEGRFYGPPMVKRLQKILKRLPSP